MNNKKLKKIMTDLAAGHITKKEADILLKDEKVAEKGSKQGKSITKKPIDTKIRKREVK